MNNGHLRHTIFGVVFIAALLPLLLFGFYMLQTWESVLKEQYKKHFEIYNVRLSNETASYLSQNEKLISTLLELRSAGLDRNNYSKLVEMFLTRNPSVVGISFLDAVGHEIVYFGMRPKINYQESVSDIIYTVIDNNKVFIGALNKNPSKKMLTLTMAFPNKIHNANRAIVVQFDLKFFEELIESSVSKENLTLIFTKNGFLIYSSADGISTVLDDSYNIEISQLINYVKNDIYGFVEVRNFSGVLSEIPSSGWVVFTGKPSKDLSFPFLSYIKKSPMLLAAVIFTALICLVILSLYLTVIIVRPVKAMTNAVTAVEQGADEVPSLPAPDNEIGVLSKTFARMLDTIKIQFEEMKQNRQDLQELNQSLQLRVGSRTRELRTALNELIKKERLAAIGQMASIVSHEIKNPLAVIKNAVYLIKARLGENAEPKILKNISVIDQEINQANGIIEEILGYARSREQILSVTDLTLYIKEILASYPMPANIKVSTEFAGTSLIVKIDTEEMKQAVRNIIGNAIEVMPEGGHLVIKTFGGEAGTAVLSIRDSGPGIPKDIMENIFTPFFTTKARGTGLGLAVVKKVAGRNNVQIELVSEEGKGTKISMIFKIYGETK